MKVIFLDIDGVLNSMSYYEKIKKISEAPLDPQTVIYLREIADKSHAVIVLTSSWRGGWEKDRSHCQIQGQIINQALEICGLSVYDKTPVLDICDPSVRCKEVLLWLRQCPESIESFVILDDANFEWDKYGLSPYWIRTDFMKNGLTEEHIAPSLAILERRNLKLIPGNLIKKIKLLLP